MASKGLRVRYVTKSGEVIEDYFPLYDRGFEKWFGDRIMHEYGMFPIPHGYISIDALTRVEEVRDDWQ